MNERLHVTELVRQFEENFGHTAGIAVMRHGELVYERYFNGHGKMDSFHIFSVTKSVTSLLIGIAMDKGYIKSADQKVLDFFPEYAVKRGEKTIGQVTLKNLLTMTAPYKYKSEPYTKVYGSEDWVKAGLDLLGGKRPIGDFLYSTVGTQILSGVLEQATGMPMISFAAEHLFTPLGIATPAPITFANKEEHLAFYRKRSATGWVTDPKGCPAAGWGLCLRPRDMANIGQMVLNQGIWDGKQLVSPSWVRESTREHSRWGELSYGYLWWILGGNTPGSFAAMGDGGNIIYVNQKEETVVAIACHFKPRAKNMMELIEQQILSLF